MGEIKDYLKSHPLAENVTLKTVTVYEVAQAPAADTFADLAQESLADQDSIHLFVHFGVHSASQVFLLEQVAWNEMNFRVPDQRGFQPTCQPICPGDGSTLENRTCGLPLTAINASLSTACRYRGLPMVDLSTDPGRFLCNYLYYISLAETSKHQNAHSLFVHVPPFEAIPKKEQLQFIHVLLSELCRSPCFC